MLRDSTDLLLSGVCRVRLRVENSSRCSRPACPAAVAAVIKVLLGCNSRNVRALVPDAKVRDRGFHEITLLDMGDIAGPDASMADLSLLCLQWPVPVVASMSLQPELEHLRHVCKKRYRGTQADGCSFCGKTIKLDMCRHVSNYHLELVQLRRCPVLWCTIWKGTPQDCMDHLRLAHAVPASVRTAHLGKWFPPWTIKCQTWSDTLNPHISGVSTDVLLFSECGTPLVHHYRVFARGISHISLRGSYLANLRIFITQSEAVGRWRHDKDPAQLSPIHRGLDSPRSIRQRDSDEESPHCKARRACSPRKLDVPAVPVSPTAASSWDFRSLLYDGRPYCQCRFACRIWWGITSSCRLVCRV